MVTVRLRRGYVAQTMDCRRTVTAHPWSGTGATMADHAELVREHPEPCRPSLRRWMEAHRAAAELRLGLPAGHPGAIHDDAYAAAVAAWAAWNDVSDDVRTLLEIEAIQDTEATPAAMEATPEGTPDRGTP